MSETALLDDALLTHLEAMLDTAHSPVCELTIEIDGTVVAGHVGPKLVVLTGPADPGRVAITSAQTTEIPGILADMIDLGPRRFHPLVEPVELDKGDVEALISGRPGIVDDVDGTPPLRWSIAASWEPGSSRIVETLDSGTRLWSITTLADGRTRLDPVAPTHVFRRLAGLLPTDDDIGSKP